MEGRRSWQKGRNGRNGRRRIINKGENQLLHGVVFFFFFFLCILLPLCEVSTCEQWTKNSHFPFFATTRIEVLLFIKNVSSIP